MKNEFERVQKILGQAVDDVPWEEKTAYANWLAQTYCYASKSTRILALASAHFPESENKFHFRYIEHALEERGHEKLLLNDLKSIGKDLKDFPELPEMSAFYQCLYYWIEHINPVGMFGWVLCLEGLAVKKGDVLFKRVKAGHGEKSCSFLKVHSNEDIGHLAKAFELLTTLTSEQQALIMQNFRQCSALYTHVLREIAAATKTGQRAQVA